MSNLTACEPGWVAVFAMSDANDDFELEPIACWLHVDAPHGMGEVRPICALGGEVCDATQAANYVGVIGPIDAVSKAALKLVTAYHESRKSESAA